MLSPSVRFAASSLAEGAFGAHRQITICCSAESKLYFLLNSQNATALAAATFRESTPWYMGIFTV